MRRTIRLNGGPYHNTFRTMYEGNSLSLNGHDYKQSPDCELVFIYQYKPPPMNAQECYDAVIKARNDQEKQKRDTIYAGITKAVSQLHLYYTYSGSISMELTTELTEAGFKVSVGSQYNETYTSISWDLK